MFYALAWSLVVALLLLWSLAAWALNAAAVWTVSNAGALSGAASGASTAALPGCTCSSPCGAAAAAAAPVPAPALGWRQADGAGLTDT